MTALGPGRAPFLDRPPAYATAASAHLHESAGYRAAIVELGEMGRMHVHTAEQARTIAAAFACAAGLLTCPECHEDAPWHTAQCTLRPGAEPVAVPEAVTP